MENTTTTTKSIMLTYGLYLGLVSVIISVANYSFGNVYKPHMAVNIISYVLIIAFIVLGLRAYKIGNKGFLRLGEAIKIGVGIALVSGIIAAIYFFMFSSYVEPDFTEKMGEFQEQLMYEKFPEMDEEIIEKQIEMSKKFMSPSIMAGMTIIGNLIIGLIISLIAGLIMKKEETDF